MKKLSLISIYSQTFKAIRKQPKVIMPFAVFAAIEAVILTLVFLSPRVPFNKVFGPIIRAFWGEPFMHYPTNFLLLPKLDSVFRTYLSVILASFLSGLAVLIAQDIFLNKTVKLRHLARVAWSKYAQLFGAVLLITLFFVFSLKLIDFTALKLLGGKRWLGIFLTVFNIVYSVLVQTVFIYVIPCLLLGKEKFFRSFGSSLKIVAKHFWLTFGLVVLPVLVYLPVIVLQGNAAFLINKFVPEIVLVLSYASILVSSLVMDLLSTVSTAFVYLRLKQP